MEQNVSFVFFLLLLLLIRCSARSAPVSDLVPVPVPGPTPASSSVEASVFVRHLNFTERPSLRDCPSEKHTVITEDGYVLAMFRIRGCSYCKKINKPPVLLLHGLFQTSDNLLDAGPNAALPYLLSDACYDLWMPNHRGNRYSRQHMRLDPDRNPDFWDFTLDEMGIYDLPASIDYVLNATGAEVVDFIGYSQGTSVFYIMCSERPEYQKKIGLSFVLAPFTSSKHMRSIIFKTLTKVVYVLRNLLHGIGIHEILNNGGFSQRITSLLGKNKYIAEKIGSLGFGLLENHPPRSISGSTYQLLFSHFPAGTSVDAVAWYGHVITTSEFRKMDYGRDENFKRYGNHVPPAYNVSSVTVPTVVIYGRGDYMVGVEDVRDLVNKLRTVISVVEIEDPFWNHLDFAYNDNINTSYFQAIHKCLLRRAVGLV